MHRKKRVMVRGRKKVRSEYLLRLLIAVPLGIASWVYPWFTDKIRNKQRDILASVFSRVNIYTLRIKVIYKFHGII